MTAPTSYDPTAEHEKEVALPNAARRSLGPHIELQPPLTHRGTGPGLVVFLPSLPPASSSSSSHAPLEPEPVQKWAEEGFAVVGVTGVPTGDVPSALATALRGLEDCREVDIKDKVGILVFDPTVLDGVLSAVAKHSTIACLVSYGAAASSPPSLPTNFHVPVGVEAPKAAEGDNQGSVRHDTQSYIYTHAKSPLFALSALHASGEFVHAAANVAHTRSLAFLKKHIGGPFFPLEEIWDEHTAFEFETRTVAKTMGTMVQEPYVNHVPTQTGGVGRAKLTAFYRDHFIFNNPSNVDLELISRTVGVDRVIDEFIFKMTHDVMVDWMLPGVPPTGKRVEIPFIAVVNIRGDRLYHEHIWWDQATALFQIGLLPTHVPFNGQMLRLPISGIVSAEKLREPEVSPSNVMFGPEYGLQGKIQANGVNGHA